MRQAHWCWLASSAGVSQVASHCSCLQLGQTPLHLSTMTSRPSIDTVRLLVNRGADVRKTERVRGHCRLLFCYMPAARVHNSGAQHNRLLSLQEFGRSPIHFVADCTGNLPIALILVRAGASIHTLAEGVRAL